MAKKMTGNLYLDIKQGLYPNMSIVNKFGRNDAVPNGSWVFVCQEAFTAWAIGATPTTVRVKAGDAADTVAGAGAQKITVEGIVANTGLYASEELVTAGTSAGAAGTTKWARIVRAWVSQHGTYGDANTADVVIEKSAGGEDIIQINIEEGQTQYLGVVVPKGRTGYLLGADFYCDAQAGAGPSNKSANIRIMQRQGALNTVTPSSIRIVQHFDGVVGHAEFEPIAPIGPFPELTEIWGEAWGDGAVTQVSGHIVVLFIDN